MYSKLRAVVEKKLKTTQERPFWKTRQKSHTNTSSQNQTKHQTSCRFSAMKTLNNLILLRTLLNMPSTNITRRFVQNPLGNFTMSTLLNQKLNLSSDSLSSLSAKILTNLCSDWGLPCNFNWNNIFLNNMKNIWD